MNANALHSCYPPILWGPSHNPIQHRSPKCSYYLISFSTGQQLLLGQIPCLPKTKINVRQWQNWGKSRLYFKGQGHGDDDDDYSK